MLKNATPPANTISRMTVRDTVEVLGCRIDRLDMDATVRRAQQAVASREYVQHVCVNAAKLVTVHTDPQMRAIVAGCEIVSADGQAVVWASRLLGDPLPERVAGVDLMFRLFALAEQENYSVYILGAQRSVLDQAIANLRVAHPGIVVAGSRDGYFDASEQEAVAADIRASQADLLFVAISSPMKEHFLGTYGPGLGVPFVMGVGGAVDILAGVTRRAPMAWQRLGLEWLYRIVQEPRRMVRRYVVTNVKFLALLLRAMARRD